MKTNLTQDDKIYQKVALIIIVLTFLTFTETFAQGTFETKSLTDKVKSLATPAFTVFSFIIGALAIISFFRNIKDMINGDKEAMQRFGGVLVIAAVWFFLVPPLIRWMFSEAGTQQTF
jgi:hypothetical protein